MFLHPLGLLALLAVPTVLGLHLYRRRFKPHSVSALFLWSPEDRSPVAGRKREPLRTSASFWCELLVALLLALAFSGPRFFGAGESRHDVIVLDASASMNAVGLSGSVADDARALVRERIEALPRDARVTIVLSGPRPRLLAGPAAFREEALEKLDDYDPGFARHDLGPAVLLGWKLAEGGALLLVTDRFEPEAHPPEIEIVSVGRPLANLAISHATRRRAEDDDGNAYERIQLSVSNFSGDERTVPIELLALGESLERRELTVPHGDRRHLTFAVPAGSPIIEARIPGDALEVDNAAYLASVPPRTLAVSSTLSPELSKRLGLMTSTDSRSRVGRLLAAVPDVIDPGDPRAAHVLIAEGLPADRREATWVLSLETEGDERQHLIGPFLVDRRHPLMTGVTLEGVVWSRSPVLDLEGAPIVSAGNDPLMTEIRDGQGVAFRLDLDSARSSLHRSPDWPILLTNLLELRRRELPGPYRTSLTVGETFLYRGRAPAEYVFEGVGERRVIPSRGTLAVEDVVRPGTYKLMVEDQELCEVAYSFVDPAESDLRRNAPGERAGTVGGATTLAGFTWLEIALLSAALAFLALDWAVLAPRRARREDPAI